MKFLFALLLFLTGTSGFAQTGNSTTCVVGGRIINCTTQQSPTVAPIDFGAILESGRRSVPEYKPRPHQPVEQNAVVIPSQNEGRDNGLSETDMEWLRFVEKECKADYQVFNMKDKSRIDSPMFMGRALEPVKRREYRLMCLAYVKGRAENITQE